jgi:pimeloyl-ACP methyl ester carboxylesterase
MDCWRLICDPSDPKPQDQFPGWPRVIQQADNYGRAAVAYLPEIRVHGLDDPGEVWQVLAPELVKHGLDVFLLHYPNDQPVAESAQFFLEELKELARRGSRRIFIVAHSMGGLVSREMLTSPELRYMHAADTHEVPMVAMLIMVGTPNHGSQVARLRAFGEIRDHLSRISKGEGNWLGVILDGAGEAKIDLLPGSRFLSELNARPHPSGVDMLIIAGVTSPWNEQDINHWIEGIQQNVSGAQQEQVNALGTYLISMTHGLGDGLVTVESTHLEGVPHVTVDGTHLSIIRNIAKNSQRVPPAVPIIVDRLMTKQN